MLHISQGHWKDVRVGRGDVHADTQLAHLSVSFLAYLTGWFWGGACFLMGTPMENSQVERKVARTQFEPSCGTQCHQCPPPSSNPLPNRGQVICSSGLPGSSHLQWWLPTARTGLFRAQPLVVQPGKARGLTSGITLNQGGMGLGGCIHVLWLL